MIVVLLIILMLIVLFLMFINDIEENTEELIKDISECSKEIKTIIVLGAGVGEDGNPSVILRDRLDTCAELYKNIECKRILLTGDSLDERYDEVNAMKNYLINSYNISKDILLVDYYGISTFDSMKRAKEIYNINSAIVVTNEYHLPRALYLGVKNNIEVLGVSSDRSNYSNIDYYALREELAKVKDYLKINVFKK